MELNKENGAVDIVKLIMALLVIIIHKPVFAFGMEYQNYMTQNVICANAVPFFFAASAYFFFSKTGREKSDNKKLFYFEKRLFKLYFLWTVIFLPCILVKFNTGHYDQLSLKILYGQLLVIAKNFFLSKSFVHFWYINTLMLSVAIIFFLNKKLGYKSILIICILVAAVSSLTVFPFLKESAVGEIYGRIPEVFRNTFESGLLYTSGGFLLSKVRFGEKKISLNIVLLIISFIVLIINGIYAFKTSEQIFKFIQHFLTMIISVLILNLCLNIRTKTSKAYVIIRKYSTIMYFSHLLLMSEGFRYIATKTGITAFTDNAPFIYFTTVIFAFLISTVIIFLSEKPKFKILKNLY